MTSKERRERMGRLIEASCLKVFNRVSREDFGRPPPDEAIDRLKADVRSVVERLDLSQELDVMSDDQIVAELRHLESDLLSGLAHRRPS